MTLEPDEHLGALIEFFASCVENRFEDYCVSRVSEAVDTACILSDIGYVMNRPVGEHILTRRLAFGSTGQLVYPKGAREVQDSSRSKTIILQHLELSGLTFEVLAGAAQRRLRKRVSVSCYISSPASQAFGWHKDEWDSLIWQLSGTKTFLFRDAANFTLKTGALLFIRQGLIHKTVSETTSVHLSVTALPLRHD